MLQDPLHQLEIGVGGFRGDARIVGAIEELRVWHAGDDGDECVVGLVERLDRVAPVINAWGGRRSRPVPFVRLTGWSTADPPVYLVFQAVRCSTISQIVWPPVQVFRDGVLSEERKLVEVAYNVQLEESAFKPENANKATEKNKPASP